MAKRASKEVGLSADRSKEDAEKIDKKGDKSSGTGKTRKRKVVSRAKSESVRSSVGKAERTGKETALLIDQEKNAEDQPRRRPMPAVFRILFSVIFLYFIALLIAWFIEWRQLSNNVDDTWSFIERKPVIFWYDSLVIYFLLLTVSAILWRPFLSAAIIYSIAAVIMYANEQKYIYRAAPLLPEDLAMAGNAGNLMQFVDGWEVTRLVLGIVLILVGASILEYKARKYLGRDTKDLPFWEKHSLIPRATFFFLSFTALSLAMLPVVHRDRKTRSDRIEFMDADISVWNQTENYRWNGFALGFLYNIGVGELEPPEDYSKERIREIALKYQKVKSELETHHEQPDLSEVADNVVVILDETFYDPSLLSGHYGYSGGDVTPNLHEIFRHYPSGYMYSPEYGGGTANVEFAVFTGLSNYWANTVPYVNALSKNDAITGIASLAKSQGFSTTAMHSYDGTMYKRNIIYQLMDFDTFLDQSSMQHTALENDYGYISDAEIFREILDVLEDDQDDKHMVGAITMQNHGPYDIAKYPELQFRLNEEKHNQLAVESVLQSIHYADQYLGDFLRAIDQLDKRTVVLWFGDHAAGVVDDYIYSESKNERDLAHLTPYFIYANFEIDSPYSVEEVAEMNSRLGFELPTEGIDLPVVSPNCLANEMYDILGVKKPSLMYLLDTVCARTPILDNSYFDGKSQTPYDELNDYELINYDMMGGRQYWLDFADVD